MLDEGGRCVPWQTGSRAQGALLLDALMARAAAEQPGRGLDPGKRPIAGKALRDTLDTAFEAADRRRAALVEPVDFLTAVLESGDAPCKRRCAAQTHRRGAVRTTAQAQAAMGEVLGKTPTTPAGSLLERFGQDMCAMARQGKCMPVIGRDEEIRTVLQTLLRKTKNNPVLVGDAGTGTAIVEGLAQRLVAGDVPDSLQGCRVYALDLTSLVAGAKYRGEFEERLKGVVDEVSARQERSSCSSTNSILWLAPGVAGGLDAANILKPALAGGTPVHRGHNLRRVPRAH